MSDGQSEEMSISTRLIGIEAISEALPQVDYLINIKREACITQIKNNKNVIFPLNRFILKAASKYAIKFVK